MELEDEEFKYWEKYRGTSFTLKSFTKTNAFGRTFSRIKVACFSFRFISSKECNHLAFPGGTVVKDLPAMQDVSWTPG